MRVAVNDRGDAEWTILGGPARRTAIIESEADRQERRAAEQWRAGGTLSIELDPARIKGRPSFMYRATIRISGAQFISPSGRRADQTQPIMMTAVVGWMPG